MKPRRNEHGFTLLELLMVVIVIAILASIALPQYVRVTERSRIGQITQLLASVRGAELRYKAQNDVYTATLGNLDIGVPATMPTGWDTPAVDAGLTYVGSNRNSGTNSGSRVRVNFATGAVCGEGTTASADWGLTAC